MNRKNYIRISKYIMLIYAMLLPKLAFAISYDEILTNLEKIIPAFVNLILAVSFLGGLYFIIRGIMMLKAFGMPLTQMSRPGELGGPLAYIVVGAIMIYIPTTIDTVHWTIFGTGDSYVSGAGTAGQTVLGYGEGGGVESRWEDLKTILFKFINFIGLISFVRGWFIIAKSGQPGVQPGTISKGTIHVIAGIIAINAQGFVDVLRTTFGM